MSVQREYSTDLICQASTSVRIGDNETQIVVMDSLVAYMSDRLSNAPDNTKKLLESLSKIIRSRTREQNLLTIMLNGAIEAKSKDPSVRWARPPICLS
jgi:hypothetical protein